MDNETMGFLIVLAALLLALLVGGIFGELAIQNKISSLIEIKKTTIMADGVITPDEKIDFIEYSSRVPHSLMYFIKECSKSTLPCDTSYYSELQIKEIEENINLKIGERK